MKYGEEKEEMISFFVLRLQRGKVVSQKSDILRMEVKSQKNQDKEKSCNHPWIGINGKLKNKHMKYRICFPQTHFETIIYHENSSGLIETLYITERSSGQEQF